MKHLILFVSLFIFSACLGDKDPSLKDDSTILETQVSASTTQKQELKNHFDLYLNQLKSLNADAIISMTYPKLFIPINRSMFREFINTMVNSPDLEISSFQTNITHIGEVNSFSNGYFTNLEYTSIITLNFINPTLYSSEKQMRFLYDIMQHKYGSNNISVNTLNRTITIIKNEKMLAIQEGMDSWKFIGDNAEYRRLYPKILPYEILGSI